MKALAKETEDLQSFLRDSGRSEILFTKKRGWMHILIGNESFSYFRAEHINLQGIKSVSYSIKKNSSQTDLLSWEEVLFYFKNWLAQLG